ncbi:MAG: phospholipase [Rhodospirillales bacterium 20-64-7]|nr:MAG: phospholipase [Rhodospirillales bacterium 20-64-7]
MNLRRSLMCASFCASTLASSLAPAAAAPVTGAQAPLTLANIAAYTDNLHTATPIKHLVVIYQENVSFDHYFGTYPHANNPAGEPAFSPRPRAITLGGTVHETAVDNLSNNHLILINPNNSAANGANAAAPYRLDRTQAATADQNHGYLAEQQAYDGGKMDLFPTYTGTASAGGVGAFGTKGQVMGIFDGNTVTALWHYAQYYAMSDNAWTDTYGPSTPGAVEAVAGQTNGVTAVLGTSSGVVPDGQGGYTLDTDVDPAYDSCSSTTRTIALTAKNIGDLLNAAKITWGGFMGGFDLGLSNANGTTGCARSTVSPTVNQTVSDYIPHHNWFQYYASTANYTHARPARLGDVGFSFQTSGAADPANHEYDLNDFTTALRHGVMPAVAYIKMPAYQDGHAGYSDPLDEQTGVVTLINQIMRSPEWKSTAIIITYDDSDGWYDHAFAAPTSSSYGTLDALNGPNTCGSGTEPNGLAGAPVHGRCGPGTRIPFMVISPFSRQDYVSHTLITQASIVKFIEDNWLSGTRLGGGSFDATTGSIDDMFDFTTGHATAPHAILQPTTGEVYQIAGSNF